MSRTVALTTTIALTIMFGRVPTSSATTNDATAAELLWEEHYSEKGFEVDFFVTRATDGTILSAEALDVWTDGTTVWWDGTTNGQHVNGSAAAIDVLDPDVPPAFCLHPIGAIVCIGALVVLFGGCGAGFGCPPPEGTKPAGLLRARRGRRRRWQ